MTSLYVNKLVKDSKIKNIADIDDILKDLCGYKSYLSHLERIKIVDSIFDIKEETVKEVFHKITEFGHCYHYFCKCIMFAISVRPKQENILNSLLSLLKEEKFESYPLIQHSDSLSDAIIKDDIEPFIKTTAECDFNPNNKIETITESAIYLVDEQESVSYMQLMAFVGAVKCLRVALCMKCFSLKKVEKYAIAGGNNEVVKILQQEGVDFTDCFKTSVMFHRNALSDWLLNNYDCKVFPIDSGIEFFNDRVFFFFVENNIGCTKEGRDDCFRISIINDNVQIVKYLFEKRKVAIQREKTYVTNVSLYHSLPTLLNDAIVTKDLELVKYLIEVCHVSVFTEDIEKGTDVIREYCEGRFSLCIACHEGDLSKVKHLVEEENYSPDQIFDGKTALHIACECGNKEIAEYFIESCDADIKETDSSERTILHIASENGNIELIKYLVEMCHMDIKEKGEYQNNSLEIACIAGNFEAVKYFVEEREVYPYDTENFSTSRFDDDDDEEQRVFPNFLFSFRNVGKFDYLKNAVENNHFNIFKFMNEKCRLDLCNITQKDIFTVVHNNNFEFFKYLIEQCNLEVEIKDNLQCNELCEACKNQNLEIIKYLIDEFHVPFNTYIFKNSSKEINDYIAEKTLLHKACEECNLSKVKQLVEEKDYFVDQICNGKRALHIACEKGNLDIFKYLFEECHAEPEILDETILEFACKIGQFNIIKYLIEECHIDANQEFSDNKTALHCVCESGKLDAVKYFVEKCHLEVNDESRKHKNAFYYASKRDNLELLRYLVDVCHANTGKIDKDALLNACLSGNLDLIKFLIEVCHVDPEKTNSSCESLLFSTCKNSKIEIFKYLVEECKLDTNEKGDEGETVLHVACENGNMDVIKYLIDDLHFDIESKTNYGLTALNYAVKGNTFEVIKYLVEECGANLKVRDCFGEDLLYYAEKMETFKYLVDVGSFKLNKTSLDNAIRGNKFEIVKYLVDECKLDTKEEEEEELSTNFNPDDQKDFNENFVYELSNLLFNTQAPQENEEEEKLSTNPYLENLNALEEEEEEEEEKLSTNFFLENLNNFEGNIFYELSNLLFNSRSPQENDEEKEENDSDEEKDDDDSSSSISVD